MTRAQGDARASARRAPARALALLAALGCHEHAALPPPARNDDERIAAAEQLILAGRYSEVPPLLEPLLASYPGTGRAELLLGFSLHKQKHHARARPHLERALELAPFEKQHAAWYSLGWCCYELGDLACARAAFERHLAADPAEGDSHFGLGLVALDEDRLDEARAHLERALELSQAAAQRGRSSPREVAKVHARLADVHLARDELERARDELASCVRIWPGAYSAWYKLHQVFTRLGEPELAARSIEQYERWRAAASEPSSEGR